MTTEDVTRVRMFSVYPGQALVSALALTYLFDGLDSAAATTTHGWCAAEGSDSPGSGGVNTKAVQCMLDYRKHGDVDRCVADLYEAWGRLVLHQASYRHQYAEGVRQAAAVEAELRERLPAFVFLRSRGLGTAAGGEE